MGGELMVMSVRELDRLAVIKQVLARRLTRVKAGDIMPLTPRQARLCAAYERDGASGRFAEARRRSTRRSIPLARTASP